VVGLHMALARRSRRVPFDEDKGVGRLNALEALELWPLWLVSDCVRVAFDPGQPLIAPVGANEWRRRSARPAGATSAQRSAPLAGSAPDAPCSSDG
jgi:hypothetical protein